MNEAVINLECKSLLKVALRPAFARRMPHSLIYFIDTKTRLSDLRRVTQ
jgi:hypothetical protein